MCLLPSMLAPESQRAAFLKELRAQGAQRQYLSTRVAARAGHSPQHRGHPATPPGRGHSGAAFPTAPPRPLSPPEAEPREMASAEGPARAGTAPPGPAHLRPALQHGPARTTRPRLRRSTAPAPGLRGRGCRAWPQGRRKGTKPQSLDPGILGVSLEMGDLVHPAPASPST